MKTKIFQERRSAEVSRSGTGKRNNDFTLAEQ